jgi:hypothetical protein
VLAANGSDPGRVIDTRSGAPASLPAGTELTDGGGTFATGYAPVAKTASRLLHFDTATLPGLSC